MIITLKCMTYASLLIRRWWNWGNTIRLNNLLGFRGLVGLKMGQRDWLHGAIPIISFGCLVFCFVLFFLQRECCLSAPNSICLQVHWMRMWWWLRRLQLQLLLSLQVRRSTSHQQTVRWRSLQWEMDSGGHFNLQQNDGKKWMTQTAFIALDEASANKINSLVSYCYLENGMDGYHAWDHACFMSPTLMIRLEILLLSCRGNCSTHLTTPEVLWGALWCLGSKFRVA